MVDHRHLHAQDNFLIGTWTYEKIPDHVDIDDEGLEIANELFKDMKLWFDQESYRFAFSWGN